VPAPQINDPRYVKAISHPLRVRILAMLQERSATPTQLAGWLGSRLGVVAYHVRTLHQLGLVELVEETRVRGAIAHTYRATERPVISDEAWARADRVAKNATDDAILQTIAEYARVSAAGGGFDRSDTHLSRMHMHLDEQGWRELADACAEALERMQQIEEESKRRGAASPHSEERTSPAGIVMMAFEAASLTEPEAVSQTHSATRRDGAARARAADGRGSPA
jgi:DNA-binding transcriptional ArsR family regulator